MKLYTIKLVSQNAQDLTAESFLETMRVIINELSLPTPEKPLYWREQGGTLFKNDGTGIYVELKNETWKRM